MRRLSAVLRAGRKGVFEEPPFWSRPPVVWGATAGREESLETSFEGYVQGAYKANGIVFACIAARVYAFCQARFQFQAFEGGRPTRLFGGPQLDLLERPWPNGTTAELLARMEQDASLAGNFYATVVDDGDGRRVRRLRPDWVTIVTGSRSGDPHALDARPVAYLYEPRGALAGDTRGGAVLLEPDRVVHYSPLPDPDAQWRGMSWLTPIVNEIRGDSAATRHKLKFFENGATHGLVISYEPGVSPEAVRQFVDQYQASHEGVSNAYRTLHLGGGAKPVSVGNSFQQLDFKVTQGAGETRIAAAAGVHPVIAGLSEGLQGTSLNSGNFTAARRRFVDLTVRPLWQTAAAALAVLVDVPAGARLWVDDRDIPFLKDDAKDAAEVMARQVEAVTALIREGFDADAAVRAVTSGDLRGLVGTHSGLVSVQLQRPGSQLEDDLRALADSAA